MIKIKTLKSGFTMSDLKTKKEKMNDEEEEEEEQSLQQCKESDGDLVI